MTTTDSETTADRFGLTGTGRASGLAGLSRKSKGAPAQEGPSGDSLTLDKIPDPDAAIGSGDVLSDAERKDLEVCEQAVRAHHTTFWVTGKALDAVANRHLYRAAYATFEDLLEDWGVTLTDSSRMRRGWRLAARLLPDVPKLSVSHVEALLPVLTSYDIEAAVTLHAVLREALPKVTARDITAIVRELPGPAADSAPAISIREQAEKALTEPDTDDPDSDGTPDATDGGHLNRAVDRRARQLADDLKRSRIPRRELNQTLAEAFADPDDPQVYRALLRWMKAREH
ncbi:hypothetical protein [Rhodococcus qingshengii]|uniref:hypothetical protein n=1 Tax=Rhodococcus qingshengii TaxID=334542 RepID=UPI0036FD352D